MLALAGALTACARPAPPAIVSGPAALACRAVVDDAGARLPVRVEWIAPSDASSVRGLDADCAMVGPAVYRPGPPDRGSVSVDDVVVVTWNVHVGGGDIGQFVDELRRGAFTGGRPVREFVLLLQEVLRVDRTVPVSTPPGLAVPARILARTPSGIRSMATEVAARLDLALFYAPSMRNGRDAAEDRGNAILSTLPLSGLTVIELPYERQRRAAVSATITDRGPAPAWTLRLASAQLNAGSRLARLWLLSSAVRERQAEHLARALDTSDVPTLLGADLNTWAGAMHEPAYAVLQRHFPQTPRDAFAPFRGALVLDYLLIRAPAAWSLRTRAVASRLGSDHRPLVGILHMN